jgi:hypothetical protein
VPSPKTQPPWEFLLSASRNSLQSYELSRLSHAANLRKEIGALLDQWIEENACAMLARLLIQQRERPSRALESAPAEEVLPGNGHSVSDNIFADRAGPRAVNGGPA